MWLNHIQLLGQYFGEDLLTPNKKREWCEVSQAEGEHQRDEDKGHLAKRWLEKWFMKSRINVHPGHTVLQKGTELKQSSVKAGAKFCQICSQEPAGLRTRGNAENSKTKAPLRVLYLQLKSSSSEEVHNSWGTSGPSRALSFFLYSHTKRQPRHEK